MVNVPHDAGSYARPPRCGALMLMGDSRLYSRPLPGGGFVAIEATEPGPDGVSVYAQLLVERRADPARRAGHPPPIVAEALAADMQRALDALYGIAANNVEIARALQRWQTLRGRGEA